MRHKISRQLNNVNEPSLRIDYSWVQLVQLTSKKDSHMRELENLIEHYVSIRRRRHSFISTGLAVKALKQIVPACSVSDSDLANMIANRAIDYNLPVSFDLNES